MKLHEYQTKACFADYGIPIPVGKVVHTTDEVLEVVQAINGRVVIKAQVHISNRERWGGIYLADSPSEAQRHVDMLLGSTIQELTVNKILIEKAIDVIDHLFVAITNDPASGKSVLIVSNEGGAHVENAAQGSFNSIFREYIDPLIGLRDYQIRRCASNLNLSRALWTDFYDIVQAMYRCYIENDATLVEINPLAITSDAKFMALDGKLTVDDNALFRQPELALMRDVSAEHPTETIAREAGLSYIKLGGQIGCIVNGAGLAMTIMDMIKMYGNGEVEPSNFLDVGGGADADKISDALQIILSDPDVKSVLINVFGGVTRCDEVAHGIIKVCEEMRPDIPMVIRLQGTSAERAHQLLKSSRAVNYIEAHTLTEVTQRAIASIRKRIP